MSSRQRSRLLWAAGLVAVVGLPLLGASLRTPARDGCFLDGVGMRPEYQVRVVDPRGRDRLFCCIGCARRWLAGEKTPPSAIWVRDEPTGREVPARAAHFVRSLVVTTPTSGNRIHVFLRKTDAEAHAAQFQGTLLSSSEAPFAGSFHDQIAR